MCIALRPGQPQALTENCDHWLFSSTTGTTLLIVFLNLNFLICKMGIKKPYPLSVYGCEE